MTNSLYAVFRKYCREHGEELLLGAFDQFVFIYFIILLINCEKQPVFCVDICLKASPHLFLFNINRDLQKFTSQGYRRSVII